MWECGGGGGGALLASFSPQANREKVDKKERGEEVLVFTPGRDAFTKGCLANKRHAQGIRLKYKAPQCG